MFKTTMKMTALEDPMLTYLTVVNGLITIVRVATVPAALIYAILLLRRIARGTGKQQ